MRQLSLMFLNNLFTVFQDSYPDFPPIWCSESEAPQLVEIVEKINAITSNSHLLFAMTKTLAIELFTMIKVEVPTSVLEATLISDEKV